MFLFFLFLISTLATCQKSPAPPAFYTKKKFSLMAGSSHLSVRENESYNQYGAYKIGFSVGIGTVQSLTSHLQLQERVLFEQKGYKTSEPVSGTNGGKSIRSHSFNYLTFTVAPQYLFGNRKHMSIGLGCYLGMLMKVKVKTIYTPLNLHSSSLATDGYPRVDYGITLNISYSVPLSKKILIDLNLIENYGLRELGKSSTIGFLKMNSMVLMVGIRKR